MLVSWFLSVANRAFTLFSTLLRALASKNQTKGGRPKKNGFHSYFLYEWAFGQHEQTWLLFCISGFVAMVTIKYRFYPFSWLFSVFEGWKLAKVKVSLHVNETPDQTQSSCDLGPFPLLHIPRLREAQIIVLWNNPLFAEGCFVQNWVSWKKSFLKWP